MTHQNYIDRCKFYKDERVCPYEVTDERKFYWSAEKLYVESVEASPDGMMDYLAKHVKNDDVRALCHEDDGVAPALTSFLFTYYETFAGDYRTMDEIVAGFKKWYNQYKLTARI